jgi:amino-acid N-acetyltransferase
MVMRVVVDNGPARQRKAPARSKRAPIALRAATAADAPALHALIAAHVEEGRLLPRTLDELTVHAPRFVVAEQTGSAGARLVGCAELAPLSSTVAEVRSLVVAREARRRGLGEQMVEALAAHARRDGYAKLCAFAHDPAFFVHRGFSIVPHTWVPEKIAHDCVSCPLFRNCGQYAVVREVVQTGVRTGVQTTVPTGVPTTVRTHV